MRIIHTDDIEIWALDSKQHESIWYVAWKVRKKLRKYKFKHPHSDLNYAFDILDNFWQKILKILDYETSGKRILDLWCGAKKGNVESKYFKQRYQPWLGRFIHATRDKTGIDYVGVDIGDLSSEKFNGIQMDLLKKNCLTNNFIENQFDLVISKRLFDSPELEKQISNTESELNATYESALELKANILPQIERILKPDWIFLWQGGNTELFKSK